MSRQGSVSLHSLDSPPSQTRLAYPLVPHASSSMHDPHAGALVDFQSQRYSVDSYAMPASAAASPPHDYTMQSPMSVAHTVGAVRPKRKQVKNACSACQRACKRCDVGRPCERCIKYGMQDSCRDSLRKERKKGVKRGPYKKRDGESALAVPAPRSVADVAPPGMLNELQRNVPTKTRTSRVSSISEPPSQASTSASVSQMDQSASAAAVPLYIQSIPSARPSEGPFPYSTAVMIPAPTQHPSLASMHPSSSHASMHHSTRGENQYYQPRYDLAPPRSGHFRMDSYPAQQDYQTKQVMVDHRSVRLQYQSSEDSPPRERQYSTQMYNDNPHRHAMIQASPHHDVSYQSQSEPTHDSPRTIDAHYPYAGQQRSYERTYQERSYASEGHMQDTHAQEIQQPQYYSSYSAYQNPSSSYAPHSYGYSQNHASHAMGPAQQVSDQPDAGYMNRATPDQVSYGSINSYPAQQQSYPTQHSSHVSSDVEYAVRSAGRLMHRDMVAHPHVGNVQIQSN
ncbi:hypothetical protein FRC06_007845 [Ceratobasidium sp. 370]|nr:hypothetical protein FRC06_007845 [Ceratobasidium sp. 370]